MDLAVLAVIAGMIALPWYVNKKKHPERELSSACFIWMLQGYWPILILFAAAVVDKFILNDLIQNFLKQHGLMKVVPPILGVVIFLLIMRTVKQADRRISSAPNNELTDNTR